MKYIILLLFGISKAIYINGDCGGSNAEALTPFDLNEYLGVWHQIGVNKRFEDVFELQYRYCVYANYSLKTDGTVRVDNHAEKEDGSAKDVIGDAVQEEANTGKFGVRFYSSAPYSPYWVINMINDSNGKYSIALVWSCEQHGGLTTVDDLWILSRSLTITDAQYNQMLSYANSTGIPVDALNMQKTNQTGCKAYNY